VQYARATKLPDELTGYMRLAESKVKVNVIGTPAVGAFDASERTKSSKPEERSLSAWLVLHEQDVAQFVRNTQQLLRLRQDPAVAALLKAKGLDQDAPAAAPAAPAGGTGSQGQPAPGP
jgi:hypothetical protein